MKIEILSRGAFGSALCTLDPGDELVSEAGAMFRASTNVEFDVTTRPRGKGGILAGIKRLVGGDSFFLSTYRVRDGAAGEVALAPTLPGEVRMVEISGTPWLCAGGSYLGSAGALDLDTQYQGLRGILTGEGVFFLRVSGTGHLLVNAFGRITELDVEDEMVVDTGHVVAFEEGLEYSLGKAGGSWVSSFTAGEGLVLHFRGRGKILVQSHNPRGFGLTIGPKLPPRS